MQTTGLPNGNVRAWGVEVWHLIVTWGMIVAIAVPSQAQRLIWLGTLGGNWSYATGVSADGSVVVGYTDWLPSERNHAFRWTMVGGMQDLHPPGARARLPTFQPTGM